VRQHMLGQKGREERENGDGRFPGDRTVKNGDTVRFGKGTEHTHTPRVYSIKKPWPREEKKRKGTGVGGGHCIVGSLSRESNEKGSFCRNRERNQEQRCCISGNKGRALKRRK